MGRRRGSVTERARAAEAAGEVLEPEFLEVVDLVKVAPEGVLRRMVGVISGVSFIVEGGDLVAVDGGEEVYRRELSPEEMELVADPFTMRVSIGDDADGERFVLEEDPAPAVRESYDFGRPVPEAVLEVDPLEDSTDQGVELDGDPTS